MAKRTDKHNRLQQLTALLKAHPEGLRKAEIARRLGVHRSTVGRYIDQLSLSLPLWERDSRIGIETDADVESEPYFNEYEGTVLLALLKLYRQEINIKNPHVSSVARKLASGFHSTAPVLAESLAESAEKIDLDESLRAGRHNSNFEKLTAAWVGSQAVRVNYIHSSTGESCNTEFEPVRFFTNKTTAETSELAVRGFCRRTGESCSLRVRDFTMLEYPVVDLDIENGYQNLFCPVSEFALCNRPMLSENEVAVLNFKESNHRIKNSLFMASGLVDITFADVVNKDVQQRARQLQARIDLIAQVHEQLSCGDGDEYINLRPFISSLVERIVGFASGNAYSVKTRVKVSKLRLKSDKALPFGMIISELLLNSFKHSIVPGDNSISLSVTGLNGTLKLRYRDGGEGFKLDPDAETCGSSLISNFCKQLNCSIGNKNNFFILEFPV